MMSLRNIAAALVVVAIALTIGLMASGGVRTAHAGLLTPDCAPLEGEVCLSLDPETDSNTVGDDHTVTAAVTFEPSGDPISDIPILILVFDGPNAGASQSVIDQTDEDGQLDLPYTGAGGTGTDSIFAVACFSDLEECVEFFEDVVIPFCLEEPENCIADLEAFCIDVELILCDNATKDWVEPTPTATPTATATPAATPAPTATPTPIPTVLAAVALPATGGTPSDGSSSLSWLAAIGSALAVISGGGLWLAHQRRRVR